MRRQRKGAKRPVLVLPGEFSESVAVAGSLAAFGGLRGEPCLRRREIRLDSIVSPRKGKLESTSEDYTVGAYESKESEDHSTIYAHCRALLQGWARLPLSL